ncbi:MAG TPA: hypothetical protein VGH99_16060 [Pseudonocardia sp.]
MSERGHEWDAPDRVRAAMHAVLSDDHSYERGLAALRELVDELVRTAGAEGLVGFAAELAVALAAAVELVAEEQGLPPAGLAEVWFVE